MRALDPEGTNVIWVSIESLLPTRENTRPLGCHRQRKSDRGCFDGMLVRLAAGCSWEDAERLCGHIRCLTLQCRPDETNGLKLEFTMQSQTKQYQVRTASSDSTLPMWH